MDAFTLWVLLVLYTITTVIYAVDIFATYKRAQALSMEFFCKGMYLLVESLIPLIVIGAYLFARKTFDFVVNVDFSPEGVLGLVIYWLFTVIGYLALHWGCNVKFRLTYGKKTLQTRQMVTYPLSFFLTAVAGLAIGIVSFSLWTRAFGGIGEFIKVANRVRGGWSDVANPMAFFKHPTGLCVVSSYAFFSLWCNKWRRWLVFVPMVIAVYFSINYLLAADGRMFAGFYFLTLVVIYIRTQAGKQQKLGTKRVLFLAVCFVGMVVLMMEMNDITEFIRTGKWPKKLADEESLLEAFIDEFMFVIRSGQYAVTNSNKLGVRFFDDLLAGIFAWLPTSLKPFTGETIWQINTHLLNPYGNATIPCDIITQGYYDLRLVGVFVFPFCLGALIRWLDKSCDNSPYGIFLFAALLFRLTRAIPYGEMYDFILGLFPLAVFSVVYWVMKLFLTKDQNRKRELV